MDAPRLGRLEEANRLLAQEVVSTRTLLRQVNDSVAAIMRQDEMVRLLAGLPPHSPDVLQAGVGGPAPKPTEAQQILASTPAGEQALQMHLDVEGMIRQANLLARSFEEARNSLQAHQDEMRHTPSIMPTRGFISSPFTEARLHPIFHDMRPHLGIDIAAPMGTPIIAPAAGLVRRRRLADRHRASRGASPESWSGVSATAAYELGSVASRSRADARRSRAPATSGWGGSRRTVPRIASRSSSERVTPSRDATIASAARPTVPKSL